MRKTILITGCSSGFGETSTRIFANRDWNVIATMRTPDLKIFADLPKVHVARLDVQDKSSISLAISQGINKFGGIDVLLNNAGFGTVGVFETIPPENVADNFGVNVFGVMDTIRAILPHFRERKAGTILNVSSGCGIAALPLSSIYCATKFAIEGFSEALYWELASQHISVKIIEPGSIMSTGFGAQVQAIADFNKTISDYNSFVAQSFQKFGRLAALGKATADNVAEVIYGAATDNTDQLRYIATDDVIPLATARRETSEKEYITFMRNL